MPRNYDDSDDRPPDLEDFLTRLVQKADQPGGAQMSGPDWPPHEPRDEPPNLGRRIVRFIGAVAVLCIAALGIKLVTADRGDPEPGSTRSGPGEAQHQGVMSLPTAKPDTAAICKDGSVSFSTHTSGTCSGHRGVRKWIHRPES